MLQNVSEAASPMSPWVLTAELSALTEQTALTKAQIRPSILSLLASGHASLIAFNAADVASVQKVFAASTGDRQVRKELKLVLHAGLTDILALRDQGLLIPNKQARFAHKVEADFVLKKMEADLHFYSTTLSTDHCLALHVRERFLGACDDRGEVLRHNPGHLDLIYRTALELLP
ncbi:hypothetical protein IFT48_03240 [Pseudomonas fluorescens]|uniref:hypothetical protein n=1 Tax=Pseudomonas fluorescens TaxID=294 RepID=UPI001930BE7E|nr:hypothetical protein [Pseudomonas fluorescens]MBD8088983.1 hypothetical protein [Pseudomonas fluorescens]